MYYRFEDRDKVYVTDSSPGGSGYCVVRADTGKRGHPVYKLTLRGVPASAESFKPGVKIKKILRDAAKGIN